jgi:hypothetical protein
MGPSDHRRLDAMPELKGVGRRCPQYDEQSRIRKEAQLTLSWLLRVIADLDVAIELVAAGKMTVQSSRVGHKSRGQRARIESDGWGTTFYALDTSELHTTLGIIQRKLDILRPLLSEKWRSKSEKPTSAEEGVPAFGRTIFLLPGVRINILDEVLPIHNGLLERFRSEYIVERSDTVVLSFLIPIGGTNDMLKRERHGQVGWHYHYCKKDGQRSDTLLAFDALNTHPTTPLFWERHGEGKAAFNARPSGWGNNKRESVYRACRPDVQARAPNEFRRPSRKARPVWPLHATLSTRVAQSS